MDCDPPLSLAPGMTVVNSHGALLLGLSASIALCGILTVQAYYYFEHYSSDRFYLRVLVGILWIVEATGSVVASYGVYRTNISDHCEISSFKDVNRGLKVVLLFNALSYAIAEGFFAYRLKVISRHAWLAGIFWLLSASRFAADITLMSFALNKTVLDFAVHGTVLYVSLVLGTVTDFWLAVVLSYWLHRRRQDDPSMKESHRIVKHLIAYSVESGAITSIFGAAILVTGVTMPFNFIWISLLIVHSKFHSNSLLVSLNRRRILSQPPREQCGDDLPLKRLNISKVRNTKKCSCSDSDPRTSNDEGANSSDTPPQVRGDMYGSHLFAIHKRDNPNPTDIAVTKHFVL